MNIYPSSIYLSPMICCYSNSTWFESISIQNSVIGICFNRFFPFLPILLGFGPETHNRLGYDYRLTAERPNPRTVFKHWLLQYDTEATILYLFTSSPSVAHPLGLITVKAGYYTPFIIHLYAGTFFVQNYFGVLQEGTGLWLLRFVRCGSGSGDDTLAGFDSINAAVHIETNLRKGTMLWKVSDRWIGMSGFIYIRKRIWIMVILPEACLGWIWVRAVNHFVGCVAFSLHHGRTGLMTMIISAKQVRWE